MIILFMSSQCRNRKLSEAFKQHKLAHKKNLNWITALSRKLLSRKLTYEERRKELLQNLLEHVLSLQYKTKFALYQLLYLTLKVNS